MKGFLLVSDWVVAVSDWVVVVSDWVVAVPDWGVLGFLTRALRVSDWVVSISDWAVAVSDLSRPWVLTGVSTKSQVLCLHRKGVLCSSSRKAMVFKKSIECSLCGLKRQGGVVL